MTFHSISLLCHYHSELLNSTFKLLNLLTKRKKKEGKEEEKEKEKEKEKKKKQANKKTNHVLQCSLKGSQFVANPGGTYTLMLTQ